MMKIISISTLRFLFKVLKHESHLLFSLTCPSTAKAAVTYMFIKKTEQFRSLQDDEKCIT